MPGAGMEEVEGREDGSLGEEKRLALREKAR